MYEPKKPEIAPKAVEIRIIYPNLLVQKRAPDAGVIKSAAINTTPTACIPAATAKTVMVDNINSIRRDVFAVYTKLSAQKKEIRTILKLLEKLELKKPHYKSDLHMALNIGFC